MSSSENESLELDQPEQPKPVWDYERRQLRLGSKLVKQFTWPSKNQEAVLARFQELGWPDRIGDPIKRHPTICPKQRLHDTIKCLNRKQVNKLIKFRGDGSGHGVRIEIREEDQES